MAAAASVLIVLGTWYFQHSRQEESLLAGISEEERQVVAHMDLLEQYDLLSNLDMLENLELLEHQEVVQNL